MDQFRSMQEIKMKNDIRYILFNNFLLIIAGLAGVIMVIHIYNKRPMVNIGTAAFIVGLCLVWYYLSKYLGKYQVSRISFLIFMTFIYIPFGYLTSPGSQSAMVYMVILTVFMLSFTARKKWEHLFVVVVTLEALVLLQTEIWFPDHYYVYTDPVYRIWDLTLNLAVVLLAILGTIHFVNKRVSDHSELLFKMSITDELTGLYNRRFFMDYLKAEYNRARRHDETFSLVVIDLNNFKKVNDHYGHQIGDQVLFELGNILKENLRSYDIPARIGGDEFVIIIPGTDKTIALGMMGRIEEAFAKAMKKYEKANLSMAYGIEESTNHTMEALYQMADEELYRQKDQLKMQDKV